MSGMNVFLDGVLVGRLDQATGGGLSFTYDGDYAALASPTPLSLSMPLSGGRHTSRVVRAWLEGLLPDNAAVREEWGRRFHVSARNAFALLRHVGREAAGAVHVMPVDVDPPDAALRTGDVHALSEQQVRDMLLELTVRDAGWEVGAGSGRWSLAGAQNKVALHLLADDSWGVPRDSTPTTHILKPTRTGTRFSDSMHANEFVCQRAAGLLGLQAAHVELVDFGGAHTLVVTRYDRRRDREGTWLRLHQEDLLQAMTYPPDKKYQAEGGPSPKNIAALLGSLGRDDRDAVRRRFFDALAFTTLVGGTDAHAKNYSLLLRGSRVAMAPLYDAASYTPYLGPGEPLRLSMKVGQAWDVRDVAVEDWLEVAAALEIDPDDAMERVDRLRTGIAGAVKEAADQAPPPFTKVAREVATAVAKQGHLDVPRLRHRRS